MDGKNHTPLNQRRTSETDMEASKTRYLLLYNITTSSGQQEKKNYIYD
jgi:hypothetical protein